MQPTSTTWRSLWQSGSAKLEARVTIVGTVYTDTSAPAIARHLDGLDLVADTAGGLFVQGREKPMLDLLAAPGSITPHAKFKGQIYVLTQEEGGRHTPFGNHYRPQFYFRTTDVTGSIKLPEGVEMVMPGDNVEIEGELIAPVAMDKGLRFAIREGGRTIGAGSVTEIFE